MKNRLRRIGNTIYLGLFMVVWALKGNAQANNPSIISVTTAPSGACSAGLPNQQVAATGTQYSCQNVSGGAGTWAAIGGGSGSATSVSTHAGTSYTLQASDSGTVITFSSATAVTVTVTAGLGVGFSVTLVQLGAGIVTPTASGTTFTTSYATSGVGTSIYLIATSANTFVMQATALTTGTGPVVQQTGATLNSPTLNAPGNVVAKVTLSAQSANIGSTTLFTPSANGVYFACSEVTAGVAGGSSGVSPFTQLSYFSAADTLQKFSTLNGTISNPSINAASSTCAVMNAEAAQPITYVTGGYVAGTGLRYNLTITLISENANGQ